MNEPRLTVSGAARRLGVAPGTLRTWDRRYGIGPTEHTHGRHRLYSAADMARLELMQHALVQGASPAEAARYARAAPTTDRPPGDDRGSAPDEGAPAGGARADGARADGAPAPLAPARPEIGPVPVTSDDGAEPDPVGPDERPLRTGGRTLRMPGAGLRARGLARAALAMDPVLVRGLLEESIAADGLVVTWNDVARPVLTAVGQRWATSGRGVEVEHLLSECLLTVLAAMAGRPIPGPPARPVLVAGMPAELHSVPIAALAALLAERGIACRSLGPALPASALAAAVRRTAPAAVVLWSQLAPTADVGVVGGLPTTRPRFRTYVAGPGWDGAALPPGVARLTSLTDAVDTLEAAVRIR